MIVWTEGLSESLIRRMANNANPPTQGESTMKDLLGRYAKLMRDGRFVDASGLLIELQSRLESLEEDAARYREYKENSHIRFSLFSGRYRADNGFSVLTDWIESFDECFDTAMQANKGE